MGLSAFNRARARQAAEHKQRVQAQAEVKPESKVDEIGAGIIQTTIAEKPKGKSKLKKKGK